MNSGTCGANSQSDFAAMSEWQTQDPLTHGHALLIGNSKYERWPQLLDVPLQLQALHKGLQRHFDTIEVRQDLKADELRAALTMFVRVRGNDSNARLFIYYAGHGYTEVIPERNENRGYITALIRPASMEPEPVTIVPAFRPYRCGKYGDLWMRCLPNQFCVFSTAALLERSSPPVPPAMLQGRSLQRSWRGSSRSPRGISSRLAAPRNRFLPEARFLSFLWRRLAERPTNTATASFQRQRFMRF
jgi:hypothetical protein